MGTLTPTSHWVEQVEVDISSMGTHTPQHHTGLRRLNVDNSSMGTHTRANITLG